MSAENQPSFDLKDINELALALSKQAIPTEFTEWTWSDLEGFKLVTSIPENPEKKEQSK